MTGKLLTVIAVLWTVTAVAGEGDARTKAIFFRGITVEHEDVAYWLEGVSEKDVVRFDLETKGANCRVRNQMLLSARPEEVPVESASVIVLGDYPMFEKTLPAVVQERILAVVRDGCRLVIQGGPFSLNKCGNPQANLLQALPVELGGKWAVEFLPDGRQVSIVKAKAGATVLEKSPQGNPMVVEGVYGKGKVVVICSSVR